MAKRYQASGLEVQRHLDKCAGIARAVMERLESRVLLDAAVFDAPKVILNGGCDSVAVGDFNGDGKSDLAVANEFSTGEDGTVSILLGNGDGTFQPKADYRVGGRPLSVAVGGFNDDGKSDLAVANHDDDTVSILLGNGDGTFRPKVDYGVGAEPWSVAAGYFNRDGVLDLAVVNLADGTVSILLGNEDGTFRPKVDYDVGWQPSSVAVSDFNGDGKSDLVVASQSDNTVSILLGNGDGTFQSKVDYGVGWGWGPVAVGDFNGDGNSDLVVNGVGPIDNTVGVLLGKGYGTFRPLVDYGVDGDPTSWAVGDFNGDGKSDLALVGSGGGNVLLGNEDGTFQPKVDFDEGGGWFFVAVGDFNGDGRTDLATVDYDLSNSTVSILLNAGDFYVPVVISNLSASTAITYGDASITVSGTLTGNGTPIPNGETVTVTINGVAQTATISGGHGGFSLNYPTNSIPASMTPYVITYTYAGDANLSAASDNSTMLTVYKAVLTVTTKPQSRAYGQVNPILTGILSGVVSGDDITASYSTTATQFSDPGSYPISALLGDPNNKLSNYVVNNAGNMLTISKTSQTIIWTAPAPISYGTALDGAQLNATVTGVAGGSAPGLLVYNPPSGTIMGAGNRLLTASAAATTDYNAATASVTLTVNTVTPSFSDLSTSNAIVYGTSGITLTGVLAAGATPVPNGRVVTVTINGVARTTTMTGGNGGFSLLFPTAAISVSATPYPITFDFAGDANFNAGTDDTSSTLRVTRAVLSVTGITANNKTYDGTAAATLDAGGAMLLGVLSGDAGSVSLVTSGATGVFSSRDTGTAKTVTVDGLALTGSSASNYTLTQPTLIANITAKGLTVSGVTASDKVYDGGTSATLNWDDATLVGVIAGDAVSLNSSGASGAFADRNAGTGKMVSIGGLTLDGSDSGNYALTQPTTTASIGTKALLGSVTVARKLYDGTTAATIASRVLWGVADNDDVNYVGGTAQFASADAGTGIAVTVTGLGLSGADAGNYTVSSTATTMADITPLRGQFGRVDGRTVKLPPLQDADGDLVTFTLTAGGSGKVYGFGNAFEDIVLSGTNAKSVLTIRVKKNRHGGDGQVTIGNITSDGLVKSINASAAMLSGLVRLNTLNRNAGKAAVAMKFHQMSSAGIEVQGLPVASIVVSGNVSDSRIVTTGSITKFSAATLLDSDILVGVAMDFEGQCAGCAGDFRNTGAKLGSLNVAGKKLPKGSSYPAYVSGVQISAPSIGTMKLANADSTAGAIQANVLADTGTLTIMALNPMTADVSVLTAGSWKAGKAGRPGIFDVV